MNRTLRKRWHFIWRYLRGRTPWDSGIVPPEITAWIAAYEQNGSAPGRALDLGCGTGTTSLYLAKRGWAVTGIDFAPNAIRRARRKARRLTGPGSATFHSADVSRPDLLDQVPASEPPFDLVIDVGCLHSLLPEQQASYAANLVRLTQPGAAYLLYAFQPTLRTNGNSMGVNEDRLNTLFAPAFDLVHAAYSADVTNQRASGWYTLHRTGNQPDSPSPPRSTETEG